MNTTAKATGYTTQQTADQSLIDGLNEHAQALATVMIGGKAYKPSDLTPVLQARITASKAVAPAKSAWLEALAAYRNELATTKPLIDGLRQALLVAFAGSPATLADFGLTPRKVAVISPTTRVEAAAKAKATREARGTKGSVQKKAVKGNVSGVTVTPVTTPGSAVAGGPPTAPNPTPAGSPAVTSAPATAGAVTTAPRAS